MSHTPMNVEGWAFEYTQEMLESLRDSRAHDPAIVVYTQDGPLTNAGDWEVRSTLPSGGPGYVIVADLHRLDLRGDLFNLAEALNEDRPYWDPHMRGLAKRVPRFPRTPATLGVSTRARDPRGPRL